MKTVLTCETLTTEQAEAEIQALGQIRLTDMPVIDTPQGASLLRVLTDYGHPIPTETLLQIAMKRTMTPNVFIRRVQYLMALDRLKNDKYVTQIGKGLASSWTVSYRGSNAARTGDRGGGRKGTSAV